MFLKRTECYLQGYLLSCILILLFSTYSFSQVHDKYLYSASNPHLFAESIDFEKLKKTIALEVGMSDSDYKTFFSEYVWDRFTDDKISLIRQAKSGRITSANIHEKLELLKIKYKERYKKFLEDKGNGKVHDLHNHNQNRLEQVNGPCVNMGFENGTFSGWTGSIQDRNDGGSNDDPEPGPLQNGFLHHCMMNPTMTDPYIPGLPVVPPGKTRAVRLGNVVPGGHIAKLRQTFRVDPSNVIFTYRYAVVLEDPRGAGGHDGMNSPHFQAILIRELTGDTIDCSAYSVVVSSNLASYSRLCVEADDDESARNDGCPGNGNPAAPQVDNVSVPTGTTACANGRDFYYRNWSTVSVVLDNYLNENVTIEFSAADCVPDGHLGYAYVQAECSKLNLALPGFICSGKETKNVSAPPGFASYAWTTSNGGTITGPSNGQNITITTAGTYKVSVLPISDAKTTCPYEITYVVQNRCPIEKTFCETVKGSGAATNVNLTLYNNEIKGNVATSTVTSWHTDKPTATNTYKIADPTKATLSAKNYYAVISDPTIKDDTVMLTVKINPKPNSNFADIPVFCKGSPNYQITGVSPSGSPFQNIFSGLHVTASGIFTPNTIGSFDIKLKTTNTTTGCTDSIIKKAVVQNLPSVTANPDTIVCFSGSPLVLPLRSNANSSDSISWSSSTGTITNRNLPNATIRLTGTAPFEQQIKVYISSFSKVCPPAKDSVIIQTKQLPVVTAPADTLICASGGVINFTAKGKANYQDSVRWSGSNVTFSNITSLISTASVTAGVQSSFTLELTAFKQACPVVKDAFLVTLNPLPAITAGPDTIVCFSNSAITLPLGSNGNPLDSLVWSSSTGTIGNKNSANTSITLNGTAPFEKQIKVYISAYGKVCPGTRAIDSLIIQTRQLPVVTAPADTLICTSGGLVNFLANANVTYQDSVLWNGTGISFINGKLVRTGASVANVYPQKNSFTVELSAFKRSCPVVKDAFVVTVNPFPKVTAATDSGYCASVTNIPVKGVTEGTESVSWKVKGLSGAFTAPGNTSTSFIKPATTDTATATFILTGSTQNCGIASDSFLIYLQPVPTISATGSDSVCKSISGITASAIFTNTRGVSWKGQGGLLLPDINSATIQYQPSQAEIDAGKTILEVSTLPKSLPLCPVKTAFVNVIIYPGPTVKIPSDTTLCRSAVPSLNLKSTSSNADSLIWKSNSVTPIPRKGINTSVNLTGSTSFKVYITAYRKGCIPANDSINVKYEIPPAVKAMAQFTCLADHRVLLTGESTKEGIKSTGRWSGTGSGTFQSHQDTVLSNIYLPSNQDIINRTFTLKLSSTGQVLCPVKDTSFSWQIVPLPLAEAGPDTVVCINKPFSRNLAVQQGMKYEWVKAPSTVLSNNPSVSITPAVDTKLLLRMTNSRNCKASDSMIIVTVTPPQLSIIPKICYYNPVTVTAAITAKPNFGNYFWTKNGQRVADTANTRIISDIGTYIYTYAFKGCIESTKLEALKPPVLSVNVPPVCEGKNVMLSANQINGGKYTWDNNITIANTFTVNAGNGITGFVVLAEDSDGCKDTVISNIPVTPFPDFTLAGPPICEGQYSNISATLLNPALHGMINQFSWKKNGVAIPASTWETYVFNQTGRYTLDLGINGCVISKPIDIIAHPNPKINIPTLYKFCYETDQPLRIQSNPFSKYLWISQTGTILDTSSFVTVAPKQDTPYGLKVWNNAGCVDSITVLVRKVCPPRLFVPNVITPMSSDINSGLEIFGAHYTNFEITIFSRWGEILFNSKDPRHSWNGVYLNESMPIGNYPWLVTYEGDSEEFKGPYKKTGEVTIVR